MHGSAVRDSKELRGTARGAMSADDDTRITDEARAKSMTLVGGLVEAKRQHGAPTRVKVDPCK
jgi:hypothetical protein